MSLRNFVVCLAIITIGALAQFPSIPGLQELLPMKELQMLQGMMEGAGEDIAKCMSDHGLSAPDLSKGFFDPTDMSHDNLCFMKCSARAFGLLNDQGELAMEKLNQMRPESLNNEALKEAEDCLRKVEKVAECEDIKKLMDCKPKTAMQKS